MEAFKPPPLTHTKNLFMQYLKHPLLKLIVVTTLSSSSAAIAKNCISNIPQTTETINFGANLASTGLTIGADTPNGTVVYEDHLQTQTHSWKCTATWLQGISLNPNLGTVAGMVNTFPLGKTGLSFHLKYWENGQIGYYESLKSLGPSGSSSGGGANMLQIIKTGELAETVKIDAGYLASLQAGDLILRKFNLINPILLNSASCQTPSILVDMGSDYQLGEFDNIGPTQRKVRFNIALDQCMSGIKRVTYSLKATTPVINAAKGIIALSNNPLNAKDIGLQLMNDAGQPIALDTTYPFNGFNTTSTSFKIPLSAAYYRLGSGELKAGNGNTSVTFIVNYL